jgi:hypothetical protein
MSLLMLLLAKLLWLLLLAELLLLELHLKLYSC